MTISSVILLYVFVHPAQPGCKSTDAEYNGTTNWADIRHCLRWEDEVDNDDSFTPANFSGGIQNLSQAENYCRNPSNDSNGPWCYVNTTHGASIKYCEVPDCHGCEAEGYYEGTKSTTRAGLTCQRWDSQSPHPHKVTDPTAFQFSSLSKLTHLNEAENYCRNVDANDGVTRTKPWCYTTDNDTVWQYCDVPECYT